VVKFTISIVTQVLFARFHPFSALSYETKFEQVIDIESNRAQSLDAATEDRALRGRTSSDAAGRRHSPGSQSGIAIRPGIPESVLIFLA
jgi:hypothetical protein